MRRNGLAALLLCDLLLGCQRAAVSPYPPDPLLMSKKPIEVKAEKAVPTLAVLNEPTAPPLPFAALASLPPELQTPALARSSPVKPIPPATRGPVEATPAVLPRTPRP